MSIAFLVYPAEDKPGRRKNKSFDWTTNAGAYMVIDVLRRSGRDVKFCSPESAKEHDIVLVSLTSTFDVYNFIRAVGRKKSWRKRDFTVVVGGFGLQNVVPLRHYIDYAVFGRAENIITDLVSAIEQKRDFEHESVLNMADGIRPVKVAQPKELYPYKLDTQPRAYKEREVGCPRKCFFCHYTFARKHIKGHSGQFYGAMDWGPIKEVLFQRLLEDSDRKSKTRTALDGFSERLRFAFNKRISNEEIVETLNRASREWESSCVWLSVYHIGSYPTETDEDRAEFAETLSKVEAKKQIYMHVHVSPFRPSPLTPSAYLPANIDFDWRRFQSKTILKKDNLNAFFLPSMESPFSLLQSLLVERATEETDEIIEKICFSKKLGRMKAGQKLAALQRNFDLTPYTREYSLEEKLPTWYVEGHIPQETVRKLAAKLKESLGLADGNRR